ncbi:hypothetical protein GCM10010841_22580 [Deinococcus aerophilus]|uniref:Uncharacterized protein n=1 Tax=Deinococcus aerophilus TaxID=522488 RepID=A0ABQ2GU34_9DEIO|nr:hypothetical protein GCM10010841_22580 [Deinococcus aerophilus]
MAAVTKTILIISQASCQELRPNEFKVCDMVEIGTWKIAIIKRAFIIGIDARHLSPKIKGDNKVFSGILTKLKQITSNILILKYRETTVKIEDPEESAFPNSPRKTCPKVVAISDTGIAINLLAKT